MIVISLILLLSGMTYVVTISFQSCLNDFQRLSSVDSRNKSGQGGRTKDRNGGARSNASLLFVLGIVSAHVGWKVRGRSCVEGDKTSKESSVRGTSFVRKRP